MGALGLSAKAGLGFLVFLAGYSFCRYVNTDERYSVIRKEGEPYLYDHQNNHGLPIIEKEFQIGTLEYRLEGVLRDRHLSSVLDTLSLPDKRGDKR